jgi:two-component system, NarL family, sensor histidine kinase UhpB
LTGHFLDAQLEVLRDRWSVSGYSVPLFQLRELGDVRHLSVKFYDYNGRLLDGNEDAGSRTPTVPHWFAWLVFATSPPMQPAIRTVSFNGAPLGRLVIAPDPTYEMDEIWATSRGLLELLLVFFVLVNGLVWWAVSRAMRPVERILDGLAQIRRGNLAVRLPRFGLPEMSRIGVGFNHMAGALEVSVAENLRLTRRLLQMQESERASIARELHDEIGQCVSAIHADAVAIQNSGGEAVRESAEAIVAVTGRIKDMVRSMLQRLRPPVLEALGLATALRELVAAFQQRNPEVICALRMSGELTSLDPEFCIAVYRVVQECLTNIMVHARAHQVTIEVARADYKQADGPEAQRLPVLSLKVTDDGVGFVATADYRGFGLTGIRERVKALGGRCGIDSKPGRGTRVSVDVPAPAPLQGAA